MSLFSIIIIRNITESEVSTEVPTKEKKIVWQPKDLSIRDLANQRDDEDLILQSDYSISYFSGLLRKVSA